MRTLPNPIRGRCPVCEEEVAILPEDTGSGVRWFCSNCGHIFEPKY